MSNEAPGKSRRGFAGMDPEKQRRIASMGGKAVSANPEHMADIGRAGGETVSKDREHMAEIGAIGGKASHGGGRKKEETAPVGEVEDPAA